MWLTSSCSVIVKLISTVILSFAVAVNGVGNLLGIGDIIATDYNSSYVQTADAVQTEQDIILENENVLYVRSSFRNIFNRYFKAFGLKNLISATDIELNKNKLSIPAGTSELLDADILPSNARNTNVRFVSDTPIIATVDIYGRVTALKPGSATVYAIAEDGGYYEKCVVSVTAGAVSCDSVTLSVSGTTLTVGASEIIDYSIFPINTTDATSISVSDIDIVGASLSGGQLTVTAKAAGTAIVTLKCGNVSDTVYVNVTDLSGEGGEASVGIELNTAEVFGGETESNIGTVFRGMDSFADGGYVACGTTASISGSFEGLYNSSFGWMTPFSFVAKYTKTGAIEWIKLFGDSSASVSLYDIAVLSDGSIVTVGNYEYPSTYTQVGGIDAAVIRLSSKGGQLSKNILKGSGDDFFYSVAATSDGYVAGGKTNSSDGAFEGVTDISSIVINYDLDNAVLWKRYFNASKSSYIADIDVDADNNIFISCITTATDGKFADYEGLIGSYADTVVFKYSYEGEYIWHHVLATSGTDMFSSIAADGEGGCYVAGNYTLVSTVAPDGTLSGIHNCGGTDGLVFRLDESGERLWYKILAGFYDDFITDIVLTGNGIGVTGYSSSSNREFAELGNQGGTDGFVCFYDSDGNGIEIIAQAGSKDDAGLCVAYSASENELFVAGKTKSSDGTFAENTFGNSSVGYIGRYKITVE